MSRGRPLARAAAILLVCGTVAAVHWPVLGAQALSLDDEQFVTRNPLVTRPGLSSTGRFFAEVLEPSSVPGYSLPLTMTSLMLDWAAGGRPGNLAPFHRTNLALHLASVALIVLILEQLSGSLAAALALGLLFGLHPLTVEPVAWITERKTLLAACFGFASLLAYLEACRTGSRGATMISLAAYLLALLSKPTVLTLPLLLVVLDRWPMRRFSARTLAEKWPWALLALAFTFVSAFSLERTLVVPAGAHAEPGSWAWQIAWTLAFELSKAVWPGTLACVYEPPNPYALSNLLVLSGVIGVTALTIVLVVGARRAPWPLAGWAFFVLALVPTFRPINGVFIAAADKYLYFAAPGMLMVLAAGFAAAWARGAKLPRAGLVLLAVALAALEARGTRAAIGNWRDSLTHFRHLVAVAPRTPTLHDALGSRLFEAGAWEEAMSEYRRAIALEPGYEPAHFNLGNALATAGRTEEAIAEFRIASRLGPGDGRTVYVLALALDRAGHGAEARAEAQHALALAGGAGDEALAAQVRAFLEGAGSQR